MLDMNEVTLVGNVGKAPDVDMAPGGSRYAMFPLGTKRVWYDNERNRHERTQWHNITAWGRHADVVFNLVRKGSALLVKGRIEYRVQERAETGEALHYTDIIVAADGIVNVLWSPPGGDGDSGGAPADAA